MDLRQVEYVLAVVDRGQLHQGGRVDAGQPAVTVRRDPPARSRARRAAVPPARALGGADRRRPRLRGPGPPADPGPRRGARVGGRACGACARGHSTSCRSRPSRPIRSAGWSAASARRIRGSRCASRRPTTSAPSTPWCSTGAASSGSPSCRRAATSSCRSRSSARRSWRCARPAPGSRRRAGCPWPSCATCRWSRRRAGLSTRDLLDRALAAAGVEPLIAVETSQREAIAPLVLAGAGTSFLPAGLAEVARRPGCGRGPAGADAHPHDRSRAPPGAAHAGGAGVRGAGPAQAEPLTGRPGGTDRRGEPSRAPRRYRSPHRPSR